MEIEQFIPSPQQVLAEAQKEHRREGLDAYVETVRLLKDEKGFSLREVAAWLQHRGLHVDHNAVWRAYSKAKRHKLLTVLNEQNKRIEHRELPNEALPWME
jgi:hypothetical protein